MTDDDYDALSQKQLASIKRDMRISLEDAAVRATYKVMAELETEQEPVARLKGVDEYGPILDWYKHWIDVPIGTKLYTTPPQRTWVYLTDEHIKEIVGPYGDMPIKGYTRELFDRIEAKSKELNT